MTQVTESAPRRSTAPRIVFINGKFMAQQVTGVQRYAAQILEAADALLSKGDWQAHCRLVLLVPSERLQALPSYRSIETREVRSGRLHAWEQLRMPWAARGAMLLNLAGSAPLLKFGQVCTFHDTAVFDVPGAYSPMFVRWYRLLFSVQARLSRRLLTVSEFSRERICRHLGVSPDKVGVVHGAADHMRTLTGQPDVLGKLGVEPGRYFLAVGSANPTKNFSRLIAAFAGMPQPDARLVVVGGNNEAVFSSSGGDIARDDRRIIRAGRLSDVELKALYTHARAYVFPSIYEGFGLPPLEAMLCGCPVIAAHAASIPEICGPAAGYFAPLSVDSIRQALEKAMRDDAWLDELRAAGLRRAEMFNWDNSARGLLRELALLGLVSARAH